MQLEEDNMNRNDVLKEIKAYLPFNEEESCDKELIYKFIYDNNDAFIRDHKVAHVTASSWIVNKDKTKVLMVYHNIYNSWSWTGGHADGDEDLLHVALKEATEETGINHFKVLNDNKIYSLEVLTVEGHYKKNKYINSHLHLNVTYLLEANENDNLKAKLDENKDVKWININDLKNEVSEEWMYNHIYSKLNNKLK